MKKQLFSARIKPRARRSKERRKRLRVETLEQRRLLAASVLDGGFENPIQPDHAFEQASGTGNGTLVGSQWTITGGAGITRNLSAFQNQKIPAPEGVQHGLIQNNGSFQQTVSGFVVGGAYKLSLLTMARQDGGGGSDLEVILDQGLATEISLIDIPEVTFSTFTEVVSPTFIATKSSYALTIDSDRNEGALTGNRTTFFDDIAIRDQPIDNVLNQTVARQNQGLQAQLAKTFPSSGMWFHENFALAAYWLNQQTSDADASLIAASTNGTYDDVIANEGFHWHAYLLERIYFLFSSQSDFPELQGRMSDAAEDAVLEMLWDWASPETEIGLASPEKLNFYWGSENHDAQAWVSMWGAAQIFKDHPDYQNRTYADGSTPAAMATAFDDYFKAYVRSYTLKGLPIEIASPTYAKYTLNTWYNLFDFADDPELKEAAGALLDVYWADWALEQIDGVRGGSRHRSYAGRSSISGNGGAAHGWYSLGQGVEASKHPGVMSGATTFWRPSRAVVGLALDVNGRGNIEYTSRRLGLKDQSPPSEPPALSTYIYNAVDPDGGSLLRYTWSTPDFVMGMSQVEARPSADWTAISSQNRWNGVIFGGHDTARIFTQRPKPAVGSVYNAEWGVQKKGALILQRLSQAQSATGQMIWFDFSLNRQESGGWIFAEAADAFAAVRVVHGGYTWQPDTLDQHHSGSDLTVGEWAVLNDQFSPIIMEVARKQDYADIDAFKAEILGNALTWDGTRLDYSSTGYETTLTHFADERAAPQVDGIPLDFSPTKAYDSPYLEGDFGSGTVIINYGDDRTVHGVAPFANDANTVALWHLDEALSDASGTYYADDTSATARDSVEAREHVQSTDSISVIADGKFGDAVRFDFEAGDQYMITGSSNWPVDKGTFRFQGWFRLNPGDSGGYLAHVYDQVYLSVDASTATFAVNKSGVASDTSSTNRVTVSADISTSGQWQYIDALYDGASIKLVTEVETDSAAGNGPFIPNRRNIYVGSRKNKSNFVGDMDEVKLSAPDNVSAATVAVQSGDWNSANTWDNGVPGAMTRAIVPQGMTVTLDGTDHAAKEVVVHGVLNVAESAVSRALTTRWIHVNSNGVFRIGSESDRYDESDFVLMLTGTDPTADHVIETASGTMNVTDNDGFLMAVGGGRLQFFGEEKLSFTKLGTTADVGATQITVENVIERNFTDGALDGQDNPVTSAADDGSLNWAVGDQIVIASSAHRAYEQEEVRTIVAVNDLGTQTVITLDRALSYRHYGEIETYGQTHAAGTNAPGRTWDIDMRAEVALLNRNVRIQGTPEQDTDTQFGDRQRYDTTNPDGSVVKGIGGHTMIMATAGQTTVDGVQFDLMGQTGQLGRYPIHWHLAGDRAGDVLRNASITNSNNRGLTVHGTHNLRIEGVVQHDIQGHGFFMEDGVETGNQYIANIAYGIHKVGGAVGNTDPFKVDTHDEVQQTNNRFVSSAAFWITNPDNTWVGNVSAGAEGSGFWFALPTQAIGASAGNPIYNGVNALRTNIEEFAHNAAHSAEIGLTFDRGSDIGGTSNRYDPLDGTPVVSHFTAYQTRTAIYHRGLEQVFDELRLADNGVGTFNTYDQEIHNSLYVGHSRGNGDSTQIRRAHFLYDGPSVIADSHFAGFGEETALTFDSVGGAEKFTEHFVSGLSFEDDGTYGNISNVTPFSLALNTYSVIYDGDGSLTTAVGGGPGSVVVSDEPFMVDGDGSDFQPAGWQAWVTDNRYAEFYVRRFDLNQAIPQTLITTPEGETVELVAVTDTASEPGGSVSVKMPLIVESGDYTVEFPAGFDPATEQFNMRFEIRRRNDVPEHASTVLIFPGIGATITAAAGARVYSETALRSATETSYFHSTDGDLLVNLHVDPLASFRTTDIYTQLVARAQRTLTTALASGNWFDASIWDNGIPDETTRAIISQGVNVTLDGPDHVAKEIVVHGTLDVSEQDQLDLLAGGFEFPVQPANAFKQASGVGSGTLAGAQWTISGGAGMTRNLSAFQSGGIPAPEGDQHGLIQGGGFFRQTVSGFVPGAEYDLSLLTMARQSGSFGNDLEVVLDQGLSTEIGLIDIPEVTFSSFTEVASPTFVATKSSYTLTIASDLNEGVLTGDRTTFFDNVQFEMITSANPDDDPTPRTLTANWIHVNSGGVFQLGTEADRFDDRDFIVTLTGVDQEADHVIETTTGTMNVTNNDGFLMTASGGRLQFFGDDKLTFTKLGATVEAGADTITVANIIERNFDGTTSAASDGEINWEVGDQIVIASSSYDYNDEEVRTITAVNNTGTETILTLDSALDHRHYGEIETYGNGTRTWDIDLRAEVALLNRSITIQGTQDTDNSFGDRGRYGTDPGQNVGIGAHAMVMPGSGQITIDAVRFDKMGQTGTLGRYPMHWHVAGNRAGDVMRNSSVTNSNNRGVTVHGTQGVLLEGNVLHDIHGHGFFMEDAAETDNDFLNNITFGIHVVGGSNTTAAANDPFIVPGITRGVDGKVNGEAPRNGNGESSHDTGQQAGERFVHSAAYWITNPDNTWVGNLSAGSEGTGFWFALPETVLGLSKDTGLYNGLNPMRTNLLQFDNNTGHSSQVGLTFDRGQDISGKASSNNFSPPQRMQINRFTGYKNHGTAVYHRASVGVFNESRFADNAFSSFNTFQQEEHNILFVGHSRGNAEPETLVGGYRLYDGPGRILDSHFAGFSAENAHAFRIEGGANKFSHTRAEGITFEADGTADTLGIELYGDNFISVDQSPVFVAGRPDSISGLVYDVDGSLTGHGGGGPGHVLTPKVDFYRDSTDLTPEGWNAYISDDRFAQLRLGRIADRDGDYIPPFRISNGDGHSIVADRWNLTYVQRMYTKVNAGDYTVEFLSGIPSDGFDLNLDIARVTQPGDATVFRFVDVGKDYKPNQGTEVTSLDALRSAGSSSWFRAADGDLWMKIRESGATIRVQPTTPLVVSNSNDAGAGSLRAAIDTANTNTGFDTITFDIGADGSTHTIQPQTPLPTITDRVYIDGSTQAPLPVLDGGFESPVQPDNDWELANGSGNGTLAGSQWTMTGGAGITRNNSVFQRSSTPINTGFVPAPEGEQHALIQNTGSMTQTVTGFEIGRTYDLSMLTMGRQFGSGGGTLEVTVDAGLATEAVLLDLPEVSFTRFTKVVSSTFVATKSSYTLTIASDPSGSRTTFFDDVQFGLAGPAITIDGSVAGGSAGLEFTAPGGVDSLTVNGFANGAGIQLSAPNSFVDHVWSGVDATGTIAVPNRFGVRAISDGNTIRNSLLSGNTLAGIRVLGAADNIIADNLVGTDASGAGPIGNGQDGVELRSANGATVTGNVIAFNGDDGVLVVDASTGNTISNNSIFGNGKLGIDLGNDGVSPNDNLDADTGANDLTNFPVITGSAAVTKPAHILFHDNFDDGVSTSLDDPSARATGLLASLVKYNFTNVDAGEVAVTSGLLDWTGTNVANGSLETSNGSQDWTFRTDLGSNTHFDWAPYLAGDSYEIRFTYRSAWAHPLTFGLSDTPQPGDWAADTNGSYDYAFGAWGRNWDSGEDGNTTRTSGGAGNTEFDVVLKIDETAGTAEAWVDGAFISTQLIDFESPGRYFSFGEPTNYGGYIDDFTVFVIPAGTTTTIVGEMNGLANTAYDVELFANSQADPSGHGEARTFLGTTTVITDASGSIGFSTTIDAAIPLGDFISATATDSTAGTSEVSLAIAVALPDYGDAPATYPVTQADDGAFHVAVGPRLGDLRDGEVDGQPTTGADGDGNDEDGVMFGMINLGNPMAGVNIHLHNASLARVDAWLDFDGNGNWESDEKILDAAQVIAGLQTLNYLIPADAVAGDTYARVRVSTDGGLQPTGAADDGEVEDYLVKIAPAILPTVETIQINGGAAQRSMLTEIAVTFDTEVVVAESAFELLNRDTGVPVVSLIVNSSVVDGRTVSLITFDPDASVVTRAGGIHSLADGNYQLTINGAKVTAVTGGKAMAGQHTVGDEEADQFFRHFGDSDGDRDVDGQDYGRFGLTFLQGEGDPNFNALFDFDGDGDVDGQDYGHLGQRFLKTINF